MKVLIYLVLGGVTTVTVAWGAAYFVSIDFMDRFGPWTCVDVGERYICLEVGEHRTCTAVTAISDIRDSWDDPPAGPDINIPNWSKAAELIGNKISPSQRGLCMVFEEGRGWPFLAGEAAWLHAPNDDLLLGGTVEALFGIKVPKGKDAYGRPRTVLLPLHPIWPGLAIDTVFYAAILWLLTLGPSTARRMIRRKRGHRIKCGYSLVGLTSDKCPECGQELSARVKP